jgi:hypothetical protein
MKTNNKQIMKRRILIKAGRLFCQQNAVVSGTDKRIVFEVNAENCYESYRTWKWFKIAVFILMMLAAIGLTIDQKCDRGDFFLIVVALAVYVSVFRGINARKIMVFQMAKKWAPERRKLLSLIKIGRCWDSVIFQATNDEGEIKEEFRRLFEKIAICIATKIVKIESLTCSDTHKEEDNQKNDLNSLVYSLGMIVPWSSIFEEAIEKHGKRVQLG